MLLITISNLNKETVNDTIERVKDSTRRMKLKTINRCIMNFKLTNHS